MKVAAIPTVSSFSQGYNTGSNPAGSANNSMGYDAAFVQRSVGESQRSRSAAHRKRGFLASASALKSIIINESRRFDRRD
jgi:hypothetical protein